MLKIYLEQRHIDLDSGHKLWSVNTGKVFYEDGWNWFSSFRIKIQIILICP